MRRRGLRNGRELPWSSTRIRSSRLRRNGCVQQQLRSSTLTSVSRTSIARRDQRIPCGTRGRRGDSPNCDADLFWSVDVASTTDNNDSTDEALLSEVVDTIACLDPSSVSETLADCLWGVGQLQRRTVPKVRRISELSSSPDTVKRLRGKLVSLDADFGVLAKLVTDVVPGFLRELVEREDAGSANVFLEGERKHWPRYADAFSVGPTVLGRSARRRTIGPEWVLPRVSLCGRWPTC